MSAQPKALQLAEFLDGGGYAEEAAELRRLHALNAELLGALIEAGTCIRGDWANAIDVIDGAIAKATSQ